jgi:methylmalonyl-CoA/ethylmalonyl-CoA epimerase
MILDHTGIVVTGRFEGRTVLRKSPGPRARTEEFGDPVNDVHVQFSRDAAGLCDELITPFSPKSPVRRAPAHGRQRHQPRRLPGCRSGVPTRPASGARFSLVADARPVIAYGGALIQFFMSPVFSLVELIEAPYHGTAPSSKD